MNWQSVIPFLLENARNYFVIAGFAFLLFYVLLKKRISFSKIQLRFAKKNDYVREIVYSVISIMIFTLPPVIMLKIDAIRQHTTYYVHIATQGWIYFFAAFPLMLFVHDTYFYWLHRLIHHKSFFRYVHLVHHKSTNPSPWAAYSFHPFEAILEAGIFVVFLFLMPINGLHLLVFFIFSLSYNVYGHLGYELYPKGFSRNGIGKWINTSVNHNMHHQYFKGNYGLYFTFWDRMMGTLNENYDKQFDEVTSRNRIERSSVVSRPA
jgi:sterol desaturase/sphingolipid hydroxylase (fatty acid hydroxylase superfamily)